MSNSPAASTRTIVIDSMQGRHDDDARDCSDEVLSPEDWVSDDDRARIRATPGRVKWKPANAAFREPPAKI